MTSLRDISLLNIFRDAVKGVFSIFDFDHDLKVMLYNCHEQHHLDSKQVLFLLHKSSLTVFYVRYLTNP